MGQASAEPETKVDRGTCLSLSGICGLAQEQFWIVKRYNACLAVQAQLQRSQRPRGHEGQE